jgi:hypothetical protein
MGAAPRPAVRPTSSPRVQALPKVALNQSPMRFGTEGSDPCAIRHSGHVPTSRAIWMRTRTVMRGGTVPQSLIAILSVLISTSGAVASVLISRRAARVERLHAAEELATRFREPLLQAAFNLETRIYNIVELDFFGRFLDTDSTDSDKEYAVLNTMHVFAQYFCWVEIVRLESQFLDPRNDRRNRAHAAGLEAVSNTFADSIDIQEKCFRLFRGEQRALGEVMLVPVAVPKSEAPRWECMGYAAFVHALEDENIARWFNRLRESIAEFAENPTNRDGRLRLVQRQLMDIIDILDPHARRVPSQLRKRLEAPSS